MVLRRQLLKAVLILLVAIGTLSSQTSSLTSHHSHQHVSHCCGVCHVGHHSLLHAADNFDFHPPALAPWHRPAEQAARAMETQVVLNLSRAPPA